MPRPRFHAPALAAAVGAALLASACQTAPAYTMKTPFSPEEHAWARQPGTAALHGRGFIEPRGGAIRTCAGEGVVLMPATRYTRELQGAARSAMYNGVSNFADRLRDYIRTTRCDAEGRFAFTELPSGSWVVSTSVTSDLIGNATTRDGADTEVVLSDALWGF